MFAYIKSFFDPESRKKELYEKFNANQKIIDDIKGKEIKAEADKDNETDSAELKPIKLKEGLIQRGICSTRIGRITSFDNQYGTIDSFIIFETRKAQQFIHQIKVGTEIKYLSREDPISKHIEVVKIEAIIDELWDTEVCEVPKIEEPKKKLIENIYATIPRVIVGFVYEIKKNTVTIETEDDHIDADISKFIDFVPELGDKVSANCLVQCDEGFVDMQGSVIEVETVTALRTLKNITSSVKEIRSAYGTLSNKCFFFTKILTNGYMPKIGEEVTIDAIECKWGTYDLRCINFVCTNKIESSSEEKVESSVPKTSIPPPTEDKQQASSRYPITVSEDQNCSLTPGQRTDVVYTINNNTKTQNFRVKCIRILFNNAKMVVHSISPKENFIIKGGEASSVTFEVESTGLGNFRVKFIIEFDNFIIRRTIFAHVSNTVGEAKKIASEIISSMKCRRRYANEVFERNCEIVPGQRRFEKPRFVARKIPIFAIPEQLRKLYLLVNRNEIAIKFPVINEDLSFKNYVRRLHTLLYIEEIEYFISFRKYDRDRAHFTRQEEFLSLEIENLYERRPSLVVGDIVRAFKIWTQPGEDNRGYDGIIHKTLNDRILLKFNETFQSKYNGEDYRLEFYYSRYNFRKQHFAIDLIVDNLGQDFLFPSKINLRKNIILDAITVGEDLYVKGKHVKWYNPSLNEVQKRCVCSILRGEVLNMPYIIFGPPGTGKTMTLVECILQVAKCLPSSRLLVATPSNSSADLLTRRLIKSMALTPGELVRIVSQNLVEKDLIPEDLMPFCATTDISADWTYKNGMIQTESGLKLRVQSKMLAEHKISIGTTSTLGTLLQMGLSREHFTHAFIDEAGQCTEPETMVIATQVSKMNGQVVLAGDPHQLQSVVISTLVLECGYAVPFLERILSYPVYSKCMELNPTTSGYDPRVVTKLLYNYRALPSIVSVYNELFYESDLIPVISDEESSELEILKKVCSLITAPETKFEAHGTFFHCVFGENKQEPDSPSWYNPEEAKHIFTLILDLYRNNIEPDQIGVITPYAKQVIHLRLLFRTAETEMPKIGTVEEFQGQERDIILMSTVRSTNMNIDNDLRHSLGFVLSPKRMNVAISRAKSFVCVFGNPNVLRIDANWRRYMKYCNVNGAVMGNIENFLNE